jgi:hypothetical protein
VVNLKLIRADPVLLLLVEFCFREGFPVIPGVDYRNCDGNRVGFNLGHVLVCPRLNGPAFLAVTLRKYR